MIVRTLVLGPAQTNCYLVGAQTAEGDIAHEAVVIDPGWDADTILAEAISARLVIKAILLTHGHFDHIGAVADLKEALSIPVIAHASEVELLDARGGADLFGFNIRAVTHPDRLVAQGDVIEVGALAFEVRYVPGHTTGHVAFVDHRNQAAFVGDVLFAGSIGRTDLPGGDYDTLLASITNELLSLPDAFKVYPGHGPPTTIGREKRTNPFL